MTPFIRAWRLREAFRRIMAGESPRDKRGELTQDARRFMWQLAAFCGWSEPCIATDNTQAVDTHQTIRLLGRREVFLEIRRAMNITDEELLALKDPDEDIPS